MDIKLKNITRSRWTKTSVFILAVITISLAITIFLGMVNDNEQRYQNVLSDEYETTYEFNSEYFLEVFEELHYMINFAQADISTDKDTFEKYKNRLDGIEGLNYLVTDKVNTYSKGSLKTIEEFLARNNYFVISDGEFQGVSRSYFPYHNYNLEEDKNMVIAISYDDKALEVDKAIWAQHKQEFLKAIMWIAGLCIAGLIGIIYLVIVTGKKKDEDGIVLSSIDKIWTEVMLLVAWLTFLFSIFSYPNSDSLGNFILIPTLINPVGLEQWASFYFTLAFSALWLSIMGIIFLSLVRKIKGKIFFKSSFCYLIIKAIKRLFVNIRENIVKRKFLVKYAFQKKLFLFQKLFLGIELFLGFMIFIGAVSFEGGMVLFFGVIAIAIFIVYVYIHKNIIIDAGKLIEQIERIKAGDLTAATDIEEGSALYLPSKQLQEIGDGLKNSVEKSLKSERLKVDLVTNMSHDIKTPLTSIINYVDLLDKEKDLPPHVQDYIKILTQKSDRLKNMVQDLFELSKATSGNIEINLERLDYVKLIEQVLADFNENILKSGLDFRVNIPEQSIFILADSKKMYRIFQNLLTNSLKYSMQGTRVYITLNSDGVLTIKNTANYDMNFSEEEITERFTRGDVSRNTEGSGLGLSIVQSYVEACGGNIKITKDADLFTVTIIFNLIIA